MIGEQAEADAIAGRVRATGFGARFRRRTRSMVLTTLAALLVCSAYVLAVPPRYAGVAEALLAEQEGDAGASPWRTVILATLAGLAVSSAVAAASASAEAQKGEGQTGVAAAPATERGEDPAPPQAVAAPPNASKSDGAGPQTLEGRPSFDRFASAGALELPEALAVRLTRSRTNDGLVVLIADRGSGQALSAALETARRLSSEVATLLVDLGASQDWFADIVDREDSDRVEMPGLADLLAGRASFVEVIRRDLSTSLDVIPSGGDIGREALDDVFAALASSYDRLVFHASDWRAAPARAAAEIADAVVVVAPAARLRPALEEARQTLGAGGADILGLTARPEPAGEEVG